MLLLSPPSRRENDVAISLRAPAGDPHVAAVVAEAAMGSSCPANKAERVRSAILHSGRYDCRVSFLVVSDFVLEGLRAFLAGVGAEILVIDENGDVVTTGPSATPSTRTIGRSHARPARSRRA